MDKFDDLYRQSIVDTRQFKNPETLSKVLDLAQKMEALCKLGDEYKFMQMTGRSKEKLEETRSMLEPLEKELCFDKFPRKPIMISLFAQPSTRTRLSFESAMLRLRGEVFGSENAAEFSSFVKGETIEDAANVMGRYGDVVVMRHKGDEKHPGNKVAVDFANSCPAPMINAGAGTDQHPTQSLLDVYTIRKEIGRLDNLKVAFVGDLRNGRTVRSLVFLLAQQKNNELYFVSTDDYQLRLDMKVWLREKMRKTGVRFFEMGVSSLETILEDIDVMYVTRLQKEYEEGRENAAQSSAFMIKKKHLEKMKNSAIVMHPLPRIDEIATDVDSDRRAAYFRQAQNGLYVRMALLHMVITGNHGITGWEYNPEIAKKSYERSVSPDK